jgi:peptidoglycan/LPS O-acetylase OafA/YrhL
MIWRGLAIHASLFSYEQGIFYVRPYFRFDSILIGALIALLLYSSAEIYHRLKRSALHSPAFALLVVLALWAAFGEDISRALYVTISELLVAVVLAHVVLAPQHRIAAALRNPWLRYFGTISYSLYLWQELFITANHPSWGTLRTLPLAFLIPLTIAVTSYHVMEKPILRLKDRLVP